MKKYSILLLLAALSGCSLLPPEMMSREFIAEDIEGKDIPAALKDLTVIYGRTDIRFTDNYIALKGDAFDTYAARIVKIANSDADEFKLFISDGSKEKGSLRVNALYVTNAGNNIYGYGMSNSVNVDAPFPQVYTPSSIGGSFMDKIFLDWAVDEAHKPSPLPGSHQGTYRSTESMSGPTSYKVSATGITSEGNNYSNFEEKFLRVVPSGSDYECYTANGAYKITASEIFRGSSSESVYNPGTDITSWNSSIATK